MTTALYETRPNYTSLANDRQAESVSQAVCLFPREPWLIKVDEIFQLGNTRTSRTKPAK